MKRQIKLFLTIILFIGSIVIAHGQGNYLKISNYQLYYGWAHNFPQDYMILRKFEDDGKSYYLLVNPQNLETRIDETTPYQVKPMTIDEAKSRFKGSSYINAINAAEKQSKNIQDAGIESGMPKETGISLTADLCPSHKPVDRIIFTDIITEFQKVERPVPIALSVSGIWMRDHVHDLSWLKKLEQAGRIHVTWINHSYNHRVSAKLPLKENFLLEPGTDINYEVLETEKAMLKNGLLPSVFFRFPGLVSDQQLVLKITAFGLIPIGSDAWLAKGQKPEAGSIVLIHGNGNEPLGVKDFVKLLQDKAPQIAKKQWLLYDLRESVDQEFDE